MLSVGIVGLPNVGKSTLFNALTAGGAEVSNYPFTTIDPNVGVVPCPTLDSKALPGCSSQRNRPRPPSASSTSPGWSTGASKGEGLGNQFLGEIRQVDAIVHVIRCFAKEDVAHVFADVDPVRDAEIIDTELMLADLEVLGRAMEKRKRDWQTHPQKHEKEKQTDDRRGGTPSSAASLSDSSGSTQTTSASSRQQV